MYKSPATVVLCVVENRPVVAKKPTKLRHNLKIGCQSVSLLTKLQELLSLFLARHENSQNTHCPFLNNPGPCFDTTLTKPTLVFQILW